MKSSFGMKRWKRTILYRRLIPGERNTTTWRNNRKPGSNNWRLMSKRHKHSSQMRG